MVPATSRSARVATRIQNWMRTLPESASLRLGLLLLLALPGCAQRESVSPAPPKDAGSAQVVRRPAEPAPAEKAPSLALAPPTRETAARAPAGIVVPPEAIYVCVAEREGQRAQTVIEFAPKVLALCRKHPEMGPCQYERNVCRAGGGRVYAANGQEITMATEAEYDKRVRRVRLQAK